MNKKSAAQLVAMLGFPILGLIVVDGNIKPINTSVIQASGTIPARPTLIPFVPDHKMPTPAPLGKLTLPPVEVQSAQYPPGPPKEPTVGRVKWANDPPAQSAQPSQPPSTINLDNPRPVDCRRVIEASGDLIYNHIVTSKQLQHLWIICQKVPEAADDVVNMLETRVHPPGTQSMGLTVWRQHLGIISMVLPREEAAARLNNLIISTLKLRGEMDLLDFEPPS